MDWGHNACNLLAASLPCFLMWLSAGPPSPQVLPDAAVEAGTTALLAARRITPQQLRRRLSAAARSLHETPSNLRLWHACALTARKAAALGIESGEVADGQERAWRWCRAAEGAAMAAAAAAAAH